MISSGPVAWIPADCQVEFFPPRHGVQHLPGSFFVKTTRSLNKRVVQDAGRFASRLLRHFLYCFGHARTRPNFHGLSKTAQQDSTDSNSFAIRSIHTLVLFIICSSENLKTFHPFFLKILSLTISLLRFLSG